MTTRQRWQQLVKAWRASGLNSEQYAVGRGFTGRNLRRWEQRLREEAAATSRAPRFARVELVERAAVAEVPVVLKAGELQIEVRRGCAREALAMVLEAVRR